MTLSDENEFIGKRFETAHGNIAFHVLLTAHTWDNCAHGLVLQHEPKRKIGQGHGVAKLRA